jgi:hypothetical protein
MLVRTPMHVQTSAQTFLLVQTILRGHLSPGYRRPRLALDVGYLLGRHVRNALPLLDARPSTQK